MLRKNILVLAINLKKKPWRFISASTEAMKAGENAALVSISYLITFQAGNNLVFSFRIKNLTWSDKLMAFTGAFLAKCLFYLWFNQLF